LTIISSESGWHEAGGWPPLVATRYTLVASSPAILCNWSHGTSAFGSGAGSAASFAATTNACELSHSSSDEVKSHIGLRVLLSLTADLLYVKRDEIEERETLRTKVVLANNWQWAHR
jgi:hypothetical protein